MKISIIVPCYNQGLYIAQTLDSIIAQTFKEWECIIVNDGSTDNSAEVISKYVECDSRIKYYEIENSGVAFARNKAIELSCGEFILPLDSDDIIGSDYLELAMKAFEQNPALSLVYCKAELFGEQNDLWHLPKYSYQQLLKDNMIFCSAFYRRSDFDKTGGYDERMTHGLEDWEFWINLLNYDSQVYVIPKVCFYYRIKEVSRNANMMKQIDAKGKMIDIIFLIHHKKYIGKLNPINLYQENIQLQNKYIRSKEYKYGKRILKPFRFLQKILGKNV